MSYDMFQPSLEREEDLETQSYAINGLWYVAFLGGLVPTMILASRNAKWLKVDKKIIYICLGLGAAMLLAKIIATGILVGGQFSLETMKAIRQNTTARFIFRAMPLALYLAYYLAMKTNYNMHQLTVGEDRPLLRDGIVWSLIGGLIELLVMIAGGYIFSYVI